MHEATIDLLKRLTEACAPPGHESEVRAIFESDLAGRGEIQRDRLGSVACVRAGKPGAPRVLVECHMDEVGFIIQRVSAAGWLRFLALGGWSAWALPAQRVTILGKKGKVPGVIGSVPPHMLAAGAKGPEISDLSVDIGARTREEAEAMGVVPGCAAVPFSPFLPMAAEGMFSAKAFDNRAGVALAIEAMQRVEPGDATLIAAGCVQEELGLRGARAFVPRLEPDVAIVLEGTPADDTPGIADSPLQGRVGGGVQIRLFDPTMIASPELADLAVATAREKNIPHQIAVRSTGGTDAGAIHQTGPGVPTLVLGVPARYIHSHVSVISLSDYIAARDLLLALIPKVGKQFVARG